MTDATLMSALAAAPAFVDAGDTHGRPALPGAVLLPLGLIRPNPWNRQVSDASAAELEPSIRMHGVLQPVLVRPAPDAKPGQPLYELICGERRWRASQFAGLDGVPALLREHDDLQVQQLMLVENLQREGLHELDEAEGYDRLLRKDAGPQTLRGFTSIKDLAESIGRSESYVVQRLRLLQLFPAGKAAFRAGKLTFSLALRIARLATEADQAKAMARILDGWAGDPMTARQADQMIRDEFMLELDRAPFKITDETLLPDAGSCRSCAKRTGSNPGLFDDIGKGDTCTDSACFQRKAAAHQARLRSEAEARGMTVISGAEARKILPMAGPHYDGTPKGYLRLDEPAANIDAKRPLGKLLAKADVKTVLVEQPHTKALIPMVPEQQAAQALKAAGVIKQAKLPTTSADERATQDKHRREAAWRTAVAEAIGQAARGPAGEAPEFRAELVRRVAIMLWHEMANDLRVRIVKLLGWPPLKARWDTGPGITAAEHIGGLEGGELARYLAVALVAGQTHIAAYQGITKPTELLDMAELLGVDVQACKDSVRELAKRTPDAAAAQRAAAKASELTPETALAAAVKRAAAKAPKSKPPAARYRNAATGETWTGRGLQPAWLKAALAAGARLADFDQAAPAATAGAGGQEQAPAKAGADMAGASGEVAA